MKLDEAEQTITQLREEVKVMKNHLVYIAKKDDRVDELLGKFINLTY